MSATVLLDSPVPGVAVVTLNRPEASNALSNELKDALRDTLGTLAEDDSVRAVVLAAAGRAFCVGQDLGELHQALATDPVAATRTVAQHYNPITLLLASMPKPVVAAVNGTCVGAGLGFALACDLHVWARDAVLGTAFTKVGLTADSGLSATLARAVGVPRATQLLLTASTFDVESAVGWGFAGEVVASEDVLGTAVALATELAQGPTLAYAATKRLLAESPHISLAETLEREKVEQVALGLTRDHEAAVTAFVGRMAPTFSGR